MTGSAGPLDSSGPKPSQIADASKLGDRGTSHPIGTDVLDCIELPIVVVNRDCAVVSFNPAAATVLSLAPSDIGRRVRCIRLLADVRNLEEVCEHVIGGGTSSQWEVSDGAGSWFSVRVGPCRANNENIAGAVLTLTNVTALRASLEQAIAEREHTKSIINTVIDPLIVLDEEFRVQAGNEAFYRMFRVSRGVIGRVRIHELGTPDWDIPRLRALLNSAHSGDQPEPLEVEHELPTVGARTLLLNARCISRGSHLNRMTLVAIQDVTERKRAAVARERAEESLRRTEEELRDFVENAAVGLHWVGPDGTILWANKTELEMLGLTKDEYIGHPIADFHVDQPAIQDIMQRLTNGETVRDYEARLRCKNGSVREVLISSNVLWQGDEFIHTRCFTRDISERKRAEEVRDRLLEEVRETLRYNEIFAAILAHDLRSPLGAIVAGAGLLTRQYKNEGDKAMKPLSIIQSSAGRMSRMIEQLLDFTRARSGIGIPIEPRLLDLRELGALITTELEGTTSQEILVESTGNTCGNWDGDRLAQVIGNLLCNAVEHGESGRPIRLAIDGSNCDIVWITVSNAGLISEELLPTLFEPFRAVIAGKGRKSKGLGLGLHIVQQIVHAHGGTIDAKSSAAEGTTFRVSLPRTTLRANDRPGTSSQDPPSRSHLAE